MLSERTPAGKIYLPMMLSRAENLQDWTVSEAVVADPLLEMYHSNILSIQSIQNAPVYSLTLRWLCLLPVLGLDVGLVP